MTTTTAHQAPAFPADPGPLVKLTIADCGAKVLQSAVALGVFQVLADGRCDAATIGARAGLHPRLAEDFLDALVGLGLLERADRHYENSVTAQAFLVPGSPAYLGGFIELTNETLYDTWGRLTEALRTGEPQHLDPDKGGFVGNKHRDEGKMKRFLSGLDAFSDRMGIEIAARIDWMQCRRVVDLGGARGNLSAILVRTYPHLEAICFDLERTRPLFTEHVWQLGMGDEISFAGGDFFTDPLPTANAYLLGHILHGFADFRRRDLVRRVFEAIEPGGTIIVYDRMIDDERRDPDRLLSSLHMRLVSAEGSEYRVADCREWLRGAGFTQDRADPMLGTHTLITARKPDLASG
jgi:hypothetical protein